jgi:predicted nucleotidyltransferase component of viral defense system
MQLEEQIRKKAREAGTLQGVIEKDFALGYVLAGIARTPILNDSLVFKGGTALKKCYFGNYRFSEDLDFSTQNAPTQSKMEKALKEGLKETERLLNDVGRFSLDLERYSEKDPHPHEQEAFKIGVQFPWQNRVNCRIKIEISHHEPVILKPIARSLIHQYETPLNSMLHCYQLDEVVAEKMRTLLQSHQKLVANSWHRPRARDYYDLWHIFNRFGSELNPGRLPDLLEKKAAHAGVSFNNVADFFTNELIQEAQDNWQSNLGAFVNDLPPCNTVLAELQTLALEYFPNLA